MPLLKTIRGLLTRNSLGGYTVQSQDGKHLKFVPLDNDLREFDGKVVKIDVEEVRE